MKHEENKNMKTKKTFYETLKQHRNFWEINPKTRVKENERKNKKKRRQNEKKLIKSLDN